MSNQTKLIVILIIAGIIRLIQLDILPNGFYLDEASFAYNAYSLAKTGRDEFGQAWPVFLRSFAVYASPLYVYLTAVIFKFFTPTVFLSRLITATSGILIVYFTFKIIYALTSNNRLSLLSCLILALCPWSIFFSRGTFEANLALLLLLIGLFYWLRQQPLATSLFLALSTYAYQSHRLIANLIFLWLFLTKPNKKTLLSFVLLLTLQLPQIILLTSPGASIRLTTLSSADHLLARYFSYFSFRSLFFDPTFDPQRSIPHLSVFYPWMIIPFLFGLSFIFRPQHRRLIGFLIPIVLLSPIAAATTTDPFAIWRALPLLWALSVIVSIGLLKIPQKYLLSLLLISLVNLYSSYFILTKNIRAKDWSYGYSQLTNRLQQYKDTPILIDQTGPDYIQIAFFQQLDPDLLQQQRQIKHYYSDTNFDFNYQLKNISIRPINWRQDIYIDQIIVGKPLSISADQASEHYLSKLFDIHSPDGQLVFSAYRTNPETKLKNSKNPQGNR